MADATTDGVSQDPPGALDDPRVIPILTAEQSSLSATRALNQAEMSGRASMFVAALSGSIVAIAFVAQATRFGPETVVFALMLLPVTLFIGVTTFIRSVDLSAEEVRWVAALNRVRSAYVEMVPGLADYFATFRPDTRSGVIATLSPLRGSLSSVYGIATTPGVIAVLDSVVAAVIVGVVVLSATGQLAPTLAAAAATFAAVLVAQTIYGNRVFGRAIERVGVDAAGSPSA